MTKQAPGTQGAREGTVVGEATCSLRSGSVTPLGGWTCPRVTVRSNEVWRVPVEKWETELSE